MPMELPDIQKAKEILSNSLPQQELSKLNRINNALVHRFIAFAIQKARPASIKVITDSEEDHNYIREAAIRNREEKPLKLQGHTVHFDGYFDQARDKAKTKFLLEPGEKLGDPEYFNTLDRNQGLSELEELFENVMQGKEMYVLFMTLGPLNSTFTIPLLQITDSAYVAHSELILYRSGYEEFIRRYSDLPQDLLQERDDFFRFLHSAGELDERNNSKNIDKRRVYIDFKTNTVYSVNTQYGGNTIGAKKPALRLAISKASKEGWLAEHMFLMAVFNAESNPSKPEIKTKAGERKTYFTGAYPSMCGKTSTSMLKGEQIVGDDIAHLRFIENQVRAVNVEKGIFGIIQGVNAEDDPIIWNAFHSPGEIIFSNVLVTPEGDVYWTGSGKPLPEKGENFSGQWHPGKIGPDGKEVPPSHKNARFTIELARLENLDREALDDPKGSPVGGIIYGGRDSDTWVPVEEAFDWVHGVITKGASLESETTAATLGQEGVRKFNPFSNLDFISIPIGKYIQNHLDFGEKVTKAGGKLPKIFSVNYFLRDRETGEWLNDKLDKKVWLKWMEKRVHGEVKARKTPTGLIPLYEDLKALFKEVLNKDYTIEDYKKQFMLRVPENLAKIDRIEKIYREKIDDTPEILFKVLDEQRKRLLDAKEKHGDYIDPEVWEVVD